MSAVFVGLRAPACAGKRATLWQSEAAFIQSVTAATLPWAPVGPQATKMTY